MDLEYDCSVAPLSWVLNQGEQHCRLLPHYKQTQVTRDSAQAPKSVKFDEDALRQGGWMAEVLVARESTYITHRQSAWDRAKCTARTQPQQFNESEARSSQWRVTILTETQNL